MINWIKKKFGYHVCEEFTQWETYEQNMEQVLSFKNIPIGVTQYVETRQQRNCTLCGKLYIRTVK